jgi:RNA polymerase sigma-70 factor, ECF subfamily
MRSDLSHWSAMKKSERPTEAQLSEVWASNRPYLVDMAFAMLRDIGAAEDAVQEAFARLAIADFGGIEDKRGWLIVVTSRICLDQIGSARSRRELTHEASTIEFAGALAPPATQQDPADRVTLDDEVNLALLVVLQQLKPSERVVFVLHDVFGVPFDTISETIGRPSATCRQLARRARLKIEADNTHADVEVDSAEHRLVTEQFIQACSNGDVTALVALLDPGVSGGVDLGPADRRSGRVVRGRKHVARTLLRYFGSWTTLVSHPFWGGSVVLAFVERRLYGVIMLDLNEKVIREIHVLADPEKLGFLSDQLAISALGDV